MRCLPSDQLWCVRPFAVHVSRPNADCGTLSKSTIMDASALAKRYVREPGSATPSAAVRRALSAPGTPATTSTRYASASAWVVSARPCAEWVSPCAGVGGRMTRAGEPSAGGGEHIDRIGGCMSRMGERMNGDGEPLSRGWRADGPGGRALGRRNKGRGTTPGRLDFVLVDGAYYAYHAHRPRSHRLGARRRTVSSSQLFSPGQLRRHLCRLQS
jgi:hypothetical protein